MLFETFLNDSHLVREGYHMAGPIQKLLGEYLEWEVDHGNRLWLLCNSEIWCRMKIENQSRQDIKDCLKENSIQENAYGA